MATDRAAPFVPDWRVTPGEILAEALQERGLSQTELSRRMGRPIKTINEIVNGKAAITPETAIQLERTLGIHASFWNGLEMRYRESIARENARAELESELGWLDNFPMPQLLRLGVVRRGPEKTDQMGDLLRFFAVSSPASWEKHWARPLAAFRGSESFQSSRYAVAAWLRQGELEAESVDSVEFDEAGFREMLPSLRGTTLIYPPGASIARLQEANARVGVSVLVLPEFRATRLSGAARWIRPGRPVIQLSLRHRSDDQLWFTYFHEAWHILNSRHDVIEEARSTEVIASGDEQAADSFARDVLIPPLEFQEFVRGSDFSANAVRGFAESIGIAPGIVVGRLQRDRTLKPGELNFLKQRYAWASGPSD